eukprot:7743316-Karenia_brevis.AAC.1
MGSPGKLVYLHCHRSHRCQRNKRCRTRQGESARSCITNFERRALTRDRPTSRHVVCLLPGLSQI